MVRHKTIDLHSSAGILNSHFEFDIDSSAYKVGGPGTRICVGPIFSTFALRLSNDTDKSRTAIGAGLFNVQAHLWRQLFFLVHCPTMIYDAG